jgi:hypothetical protein
MRLFMSTESLDLAGIDGYSLRHLGHHLCLAGRAAELHKLLAHERRVTDNRAVNFWFGAHEQAADIQGYLGDLSLARADAAASTDRDLGRHSPPATLGLEIRYLLMAGTVESRAENIATALRAMTVSAGLWSPGRALDHARSLTSGSDRLQAFEALRPLLSPGQQDDLNAEALEAASEIRDDQRGAALASLAPHLHGDLLDRAAQAADAIADDASRARALTGLASAVAAEQRYALLTRALAAATAITRPGGPLISGDAQRATALAELAPQLHGDLLDRAVQAADAITDKATRARALTGLASAVAAEQRYALLTRALAAATAISRGSVSLDPNGGPERARALVDLASHLPDDLLDQALSSALEISDESPRADAVAGLAPYLPDALLARVLTALPDFTYHIAQVLAGVAPYVSESLAKKAIAIADASGDDKSRAEALLPLAPYLSEELLTWVANSTVLSTSAAPVPEEHPAELRLEDLLAEQKLEEHRAEHIVKLAPHLPADLYARVVGVTSALKDNGLRAETLAHLVPYASADQRSGLLSRALAALAASNPLFEHSRTTSVLGALAPQLPADLLAKALDMVVAVQPERERAQALVTLAPYLPVDLIALALTAATTLKDDKVRAHALAGLAPHAPSGQRQAMLEQAVAAASVTTDAAYRARVLGQLAAHASPEQQHPVLTDAVNAVGAISDERARAAAVTELAPRLPADLLDRALGIAVAITGDTDQATALGGLAPYLPAELLRAALIRATELPAPWTRIDALVPFVPYLSADQRTAVLMEIAASTAALPAMYGDFLRVKATTAMAPYLREEALVKAAAAAGDLELPESRAKVLTALASNIPTDRKKSVFKQALADVAAIKGDDTQVSALSELTAQLPADMLPRALLGATALRRLESRLKALVTLAAHLHAHPALLAQVVTVVTSVDQESPRATALARLARYLPADQLDRALASATAMQKGDAKTTALAGLMPYLNADQQSVALPQAFAVAKAANAAARAVGYAAVSVYLPDDMREFLLGEALTAATMTQEDIRADALANLAPHLSPDLLARAITAAAAIQDEDKRAVALGSLAPYADATQLARAIAARPGSRNNLLQAAVSARTSNGLSADDRAACVEVIRAGITGANHYEIVIAIGSAASAIAEIAGAAAIDDCVQAMNAVHRWWN